MTVKVVPLGTIRYDSAQVMAGHDELGVGQSIFTAREAAQAEAA
jgi:hypothetical protein